MSAEGTDTPPIPPRPPAPSWVVPPVPQPQQGGAPQQQPAWPTAQQPAWPTAQQPAWPTAQQPAWPTAQQPAWPTALPQEPPLFAAPYAAAPAGSFVDQPARRSSALGVTALVLAILAAAGASVVGAVVATQIALGVDPSPFLSPDGPSDLAFLSPVRDWVLLGEVAFWIGTVLGIWAIVQGVIAVVTGRGRAVAIVAIVVAVLGPILFLAAVTVSLVAGIDTGPVVGV